MPDHITKAMLRVMRDLKRRSKGWPVGLPAPRHTARALVSRGLAEYAPPLWLYRKPVCCIRLTTRGEVTLEMQ